MAEPRTTIVISLALAVGAAGALRADETARANLPTSALPPAGEATISTASPIEEHLIAPRRGAAQPGGGVKQRGASRSGTWALLWPTLAVLATIGAAALGLRRLLPRGVGVRSDGPIRIMARQGLSAKQSLLLVRVGRRLVLIGVSADRMETLLELPDDAESATLLAALEGAGAQSASTRFAQFLRREHAELARGAAEPVRAVGDVQTGVVAGSVRALSQRLRAFRTGAFAS
ncbi:MAG: flagellar biosynthetic protein FliO [Phycisphaerae bacterium]|nr:flagellar biosynthetic protein FliO [Phycisphaerae bacterium]